MLNAKCCTAALATAALGLAGFSASASAGVVDYPTTAGFGVPNNTGQAGIPSQVFVPPGRTAVQKAELTSVAPSFGGGGGGDLQLRLKSPAGNEISLIGNGCTTYPNTSAFTISDTGTQAIDGNPAFCTALASNPTTTSGIPAQPLATFNGQPSAGVWTVTVVDVGVSGILGSWKGWTLHLTHAAPTITGTAAKQKLAKTQFLTVTPNANGNVTVGGGAVPRGPIAVTAGKPATIPFSVTSKVKKKIKKKKKGTANVTVTLADETNGTAKATVPVKLKK